MCAVRARARAMNIIKGLRLAPHPPDKFSGHSLRTRPGCQPFLKKGKYETTLPPGILFLTPSKLIISGGIGFNKKVEWNITVGRLPWPLQAAKNSNITVCSFCRALAGGNKILKSLFAVFVGPCAWQNQLIWLDLSIVSMLKWLVLKSPIQRTSQRFKWTSGAQDMICCSLEMIGGDYFFPNLEALAGDDGVVEGHFGWRWSHLRRWSRKGWCPVPGTQPDCRFYLVNYKLPILKFYRGELFFALFQVSPGCPTFVIDLDEIWIFSGNSDRSIEIVTLLSCRLV